MPLFRLVALGKANRDSVANSPEPMSTRQNIDVLATTMPITLSFSQGK